MLNQFAVEIPTLPVKQFHSPSPDTWRNVKALFRIAAPQRRAAKHLGHTWYIGKRFCQSTSFFSSTLSSRIKLPLEENYWGTASHVYSGEEWYTERNQDLRCQSGPSAKDSVIFIGRDSSKNYGKDQQRLQISDLHFDKFPTPATFACWKIRRKTEVCTCSQFPTEAMQWIMEVELVGLSGWIEIFVIYSRYFNAEFWRTWCEDCFSTEQNHP